MKFGQEAVFFPDGSAACDRAGRRIRRSLQTLPFNLARRLTLRVGDGFRRPSPHAADPIQAVPWHDRAMPWGSVLLCCGAVMLWFGGGGAVVLLLVVGVVGSRGNGGGMGCPFYSLSTHLPIHVPTNSLPTYLPTY